MDIPPGLVLYCSEGRLGRLGLRQKIIHSQQLPVGGVAGQIVRSLFGRGIVIGSRAAILSKTDAGVAQQVVLVIHNRPLTAHEQHRFAVRQQAYLIRRQQVFAIMSSDEFKKGKKSSPLFEEGLNVTINCWVLSASHSFV